jgi:hypothetical protein
MAPRVIVGIVALAGVSIFGLLLTITSLEMAEKVSEKLPKESEFAQPGWYWSKTFRLHRQYNRLYPSGRLSLRVCVLVGLALSCLLICAWSLGFFAR